MCQQVQQADVIREVGGIYHIKALLGWGQHVGAQLQRLAAPQHHLELPLRTTGLVAAQQRLQVSQARLHAACRFCTK